MSIPCRSLMFACALIGALSPSAVGVDVEVREGVPDKRSWNFVRPDAVETYSVEGFGLVALPRKYSNRGVLVDRALPVMVTLREQIELSAGEYRLLLRSRNGARLLVDGKVVAETKFIDTRGDGHEPVPEKPAVLEEGLRFPAIGHKEKLATVRLEAGKHRFELEAFVGGQKLRPEVGELLVGIAGKGERFRLLGAARPTPMTDDGWTAYAAEQLAALKVRDDRVRKIASAAEEKYWKSRHELARREWANRPAPAVPQLPDAMPAHNDIDRYLGKRLLERKTLTPSLVDDWAFLRRVYLDTVGVIPANAEIDRYFRDEPAKRRRRLVDRLLDDPRWADHWVSYWQDVLAENPGILKPNLNNTGPFRWWLHQALGDNYALDRFVTELVRMEGSKMYGGPAGFGVASQNDAPMAAKAHILTKAFLGIEMQCARCHDAPFHPFKQRDLFEMAAMLGRGAQKLPATSTVRVAEGARTPRVKIDLKPGEKIAPRWPFDDLSPAELAAGIKAADSRERFAAILTSPRNERFPQVMVNRLWKRSFGWGLIEPVDDWPDHVEIPDLLQYLARELVVHDYDLKHVMRLMLNSHAYQRVVQPGRPDWSSENPAAGPMRRRVAAEQLVDSMFVAAGKDFQSEELCMDPEGRRPVTEMLSLGVPKRAWQFTSLSNERDRPALALPAAQGIVDLLIAYGWRDSRQNPITLRDDAPTPLQPMLLANGAAGNRIVRLSDDSQFTDMCLTDQPLSVLIDQLFRAVLTRPASAKEKALFENLLADSYSDRIVRGAQAARKKAAANSTTVSWANHLSPEATRIKLELERAARAGDPPTNRLKKEWRERFEDAVWALLNSPEFAFVP